MLDGTVPTDFDYIINWFQIQLLVFVAYGWQAVMLETGHQSKRASREYHSDASATSSLIELIGGEPVFDSLTKLEDDLYEIGRRGASKRWIGKTVTLTVEEPE